MLFEPVRLGEIEASNRIVMAPMTRSRALPVGVPGPLHAEYYAQRASAGLIVTEGTAPSADGLGYARTPGVYSAEQVAGWTAVTSAVHQAGGRIVLQVMHVGRVAHPANQPEGARILAPSPIAAAGKMWTDSAGMQPMPVPVEMTLDDIRQAIRDYAAAARNARDAGFDGIEIHSANGYLPNQFLSTNTNHRTDEYGGSVEKRSRFVLEVFEAMSAAWSPGRIGVRVSPGGSFNDMLDTEPRATYTQLARELAARGAAFLHVVRPAPFAPAEAVFDVWAELRAAFPGPFLVNGGLTLEEATRLIETRAADLVSIGRPFIANPDLPARWRNGWPIAEGDGSTFYTPGPKGYVDYPAFAGAA